MIPINLPREHLSDQRKEFPGVDQRVTIEQLADRSGRSIRTLLRWKREGLLPRRYQRGRRHYWHEDDVQVWLQQVQAVSELGQKR